MKEATNRVFLPNKTSAQLLVDYARVRLLGENQSLEGEVTDENLQRFLMLYDLYIKARSYSMLNKLSFGLAIVAGLMVLLWPSIAVISRDMGFNKEFITSAVVQTTITGVAALTFAVYSHYKKRQLFAENLMRYVLVSEESLSEIKAKVIQEMERIDTGFSFSQALFKKSAEPKGGGEG